MKKLEKQEAKLRVRRVIISDGFEAILNACFRRRLRSAHNAVCMKARNCSISNANRLVRSNT
jgi:hypothetical protein